MVNQSIGKKAINTGINNVTLEQNIPNSVYEFTSISYSIPEGAKNAQLIVTDIAGKVIKQVLLGSSSGIINFDGTGLSSGNYTYSIVIDGKIIQTKKMVVAKNN